MARLRASNAAASVVAGVTLLIDDDHVHYATADIGEFDTDGDYMLKFYSSDPDIYEICRATKRPSTAHPTDHGTIDIIRAQEGTSAREWPIGTPFFVCISKGYLTELQSEIDAAAGSVTTHAALSTGVHGVGSGTIASTATKLDAFAEPDDTTQLDATQTRHGLMPKLDKVKLDGIEAGADVTTTAKVAAAGAMMRTEAATSLTIASGAVTVTQRNHTIDTEGNAATDDLDTIYGGTDGSIITIRPASGDRTIVVKHNTGNIWMVSGADQILDDASDGLLLVYDSANSKWIGLMGAQGPQGPQGETGPQGPQGPAGSIPVYTWVISNPTVGGVLGPRLRQAHTCTRLDSYVAAATSVTFNIEERITIGSSGEDILASDQVATTSGTTTTSFVNASLAADCWLYLDISAVTGNPGQVVISLSCTV